MADVFISYSRRDRARVGVLADALEKRGLSVWWDPNLTTGFEYRQEIARELDAARAVVVAWSEHSVTSRFVCDEADVGASRDVLFPALIDLVDIPLGFRQIQTADLTRWRGSRKDRGLEEFADVICEYAGVGERGDARHSSPPAENALPTASPAESVAPDASAAPPAEPRIAPADPAEPPTENTAHRDELWPRRERASRKAGKKRAPKASETKAAYPDNWAPKSGRLHTVTGRQTRLALLWRSFALAILIAGGFGALAYATDFVFPAYRPAMIGAMAALVFVSRLFTFTADRAAGAASLHLMSRSYLALILFSMAALAPLLMEGRMYAAALQAVEMKGIEGADINGVAFSGDGGRIVTASDDGTARVWDARTGVELVAYRRHGDWVWSGAFDPEGGRIVSASRDLTAQIWDSRSGASIATLEGHRNSVYDAAWSPDGSRIATASGDQTVWIWDADKGEGRKIAEHGDAVRAVAFSADGQFVVSGADDGSAKVTRISTGETAAAFRAASEIHDVAFSGQGRIAVGDDAGAAYILNGSGAEIARLDHPARVYSVAFIGENRIATGGFDRIVRVWDINDPSAPLLEMPGHEDAVRAIAVTDDGVAIASSSRDNTARIWDARSGREAQIVGHIRPAIRVSRSLDLPPILSASRAPTAMDFRANPQDTAYIAGKGLAIAFALLFVGLFLKGALTLVRAYGAARWAVVGALGLGVAYAAALMLTALPAEAAFLWITAAFAPAAIFAIGRWSMTAAISRRS